MSLRNVYIAVIFLVMAHPPTLLFAQTETDSIPSRLSRADSYLGIHFDFHAGNDCTEIGKNVDREMIEYIIDTVGPDYIQIDCKGHPGISSYPTTVGTPAPGFVGDPLAIWREVTAERGVALYMHYSGVWDAEAVRSHPDWARITPEGTPDDRLTSVFGPYVDELLIPQLIELDDVYKVDGVWIDGDCWAAAPDYRPEVVESFLAGTNLTSVPKGRGEQGWNEWLEFNRSGFLDYMDRYTTVLHRHDPAFQVCSNWAFSSAMPLPVSIDVDFLSGDFEPRDSVRSARFEARSLAHQGKSWDLMSWHFTNTGGAGSTKTAVQLCQEAAVVLALGGGFQAYFPQYRDGSIRRWQMPIMGEVAAFCRARQEFCHRAEPIPQIGLIYYGEAFFRASDTLFGAWNAPAYRPLEGILNTLCDAQQVVDILMEHHLADRMNEYPLLVWPEWNYIDPDFKSELLEYVAAGGRLLIIGPEAVVLFKDELGVSIDGDPVVWLNGLAAGNMIGDIASTMVDIAVHDSTIVAGRMYENNDFKAPMRPAATIRSYGDGMIAGIYLGLGESYLDGSHTVVRDFLAGLVRELFPDPLITVSGSHHVDVTAMQNDGRLMINLVNTSGEHANPNVYVYDDIPPVGPLALTVRYPSPPAAITVQPGNRSVQWEYHDGEVYLTLDKLEIHDIIVVD